MLFFTHRGLGYVEWQMGEHGARWHLDDLGQLLPDLLHGGRVLLSTMFTFIALFLLHLLWRGHHYRAITCTNEFII